MISDILRPSQLVILSCYIVSAFRGVQLTKMKILEEVEGHWPTKQLSLIPDPQLLELVVEISTY